MQHTPYSNHPKTTKFDVFMLSDADVSFLNNEAPKMFDDESANGMNQPQQNTLSGFQTNSEPGSDHFSVPSRSPAGVFNNYSGNNRTFYPSQTVQDTAFTPGNNDEQVFHPPGEPLFTDEKNDSNDLIFSSVSETRFYQPRPQYSSDDIDDVLNRIIVSEPLLTDDDLLFLIKKEYTGQQTINRKVLKLALRRNRLENGYQRLRAYICGEVYE